MVIWSSKMGGTWQMEDRKKKETKKININNNKALLLIVHAISKFVDMYVDVR